MGYPHNLVILMSMSGQSSVFLMCYTLCMLCINQIMYVINSMDENAAVPQISIWSIFPVKLGIYILA